MPISRLEDFQSWILSRDARTYYLESHRFEKTSQGEILIDRGVFDLEEAQEIGEMLLSPNPFAHLAALLGIWEKNGTLIKLVLGGTIFLLIVVIFIVSR